MRQLSKLEGILLLVGGLLMVVGAGANVLFCSWAPYVYAPGSLLFVAMQLRQRYEGRNFTIRRLRRIQVVKSNFLPLDQLSYIKYVHNNWVIVLLVAAILQLYTSHRIANELEKDTK